MNGYLFHHYFCGLNRLLYEWLRIKILKSILGFFIPFLENPFLIILPRMKISLHSHSLITGIFQTPSTPESGHSSEAQSRGWSRVRDSHLPGCQETWPCSQWFLKPPPKPPNPTSPPRAVWTPPRGNLLCLKLYRYSKVKGSAKNNFPRQSEQIILMRAWEWETNDTKLASLPFVNCVGEGTKPPSESAVGEPKAASVFGKFLAEAPHLPFPELLFPLTQESVHIISRQSGPITAGPQVL